MIIKNPFSGLKLKWKVLIQLQIWPHYDYKNSYLGMGSTLEMWKIMLLTFLMYTTLAPGQEMQPSNLQPSLAYAAAFIEENKIYWIRREGEMPITE